ncbi:hypothetical protein [Entomohabitans teleogrylli]|uniref:hypothetical protein n=1 Tax=Entomohabitans teleogrylli TaxID=1384589 RepID=UPI00073D24CE|nr:hypothetical protein [Entomohabitans teleogrylli]
MNTDLSDEPEYTNGSYHEFPAGSTDSRLSRIEADIDHVKSMLRDIKDDAREVRQDMRSDFKLLFGALIAAVLGLAGIMAHGFGWL